MDRPVSGACFDGSMEITPASVRRETARRLRHTSLRIGDDIRRMRLEAGVTLSDLVRVVGVHPSHIGRIESSTIQPSVKVMTAIGIALGADLGASRCRSPTRLVASSTSFSRMGWHRSR
jgi:DNA-binding XRE family transcriptional regulator